MSNLLRIEPSKFHPETEGWYVYDDGRAYLRPLHNDAQEAFGRGPMIMSDNLEAPVVSQANGKTYESKSALYASYQPGGNPQGVRYEVVGNEPIRPFERKTSSKYDRIQAVKRAMGAL